MIDCNRFELMMKNPFPKRERLFILFQSFFFSSHFFFDCETGRKKQSVSEVNPIKLLCHMKIKVHFFNTTPSSSQYTISPMNTISLDSSIKTNQMNKIFQNGKYEINFLFLFSFFSFEKKKKRARAFKSKKNLTLYTPIL